MKSVDAHFTRTLRVLFEAADVDGSGGLDPDEFVSVLQSKVLDLELSEQELDEIKQFADKDGDGVIDFDEFVPVVEQLLNRVKKKTKKPRARKMWALAGTAARLSSTARVYKKSDGTKAASCTSTLDVLRLRREGLRALNEHNLPRAEEMMRCAVQIAGKAKANSAQHINCMARLGDIVLKRGRLHEAIKMYNNCLDRLHEIFGPRGHSAIAECLSSMSHAFVQLGRLQEGETYSCAAVDVVDTLNRKSNGASGHDAALLPLLTEHARILKLVGKPTKMTQAIARMVPIKVRNFTKTQRETASTLKGLRVIEDVLTSQGAHDIELRLQEEALHGVRSGAGDPMAFSDSAIRAG
jgi:hypothetical protein